MRLKKCGWAAALLMAGCAGAGVAGEPARPSTAEILLAWQKLGGEVAEGEEPREVISLPAPVTTGGMALADALTARKSSREFADTAFTPEELSSLLWAAAGVNRPDPAGGDAAKYTYPTARNRRDMLVFVFLPWGTYCYDARDHALRLAVAGDNRALAGRQPFAANAAANFAVVHDLNKWAENEREHAAEMGLFHAGAILQNAALHAAARDWSAVVRGLFDGPALAEFLTLSPGQRVVMTFSVGPKP